MRHQNQIDGVLKIEGSVDLEAASALRDALAAALAANASVAIDLSGVDACDTSAIQLLCAARKTASLERKGWRIAAASDSLIAAGAALGIPEDEWKFPAEYGQN